MKLNHDCVRALLIFLEENLEVKGNGTPDCLKLGHITDEGDLANYLEEDIYYAASKLVEAKFIIPVNKDVSPKFLMIKEISWNGHDYLDSIRDSKVWSEVKDKTKGFSSVAFANS